MCQVQADAGLHDRALLEADGHHEFSVPQSPSPHLSRLTRWLRAEVPAGGEDMPSTSWCRWFSRVAGMILILLLGPFVMPAFGGLDLETHWSQASLAAPHQGCDNVKRCLDTYLARLRLRPTRHEAAPVDRQWPKLLYIAA